MQYHHNVILEHVPFVHSIPSSFLLPSSTPTLATTNLPSVSMALPILDIDINEIIHVVSCDCIFSLCRMLSGLTHMVVASMVTS